MSSDEEDDFVYNPLKLPMGWDGKPIPYWLYKLHGLNQVPSAGQSASAPMSSRGTACCAQQAGVSRMHAAHCPSW